MNFKSHFITTSEYQALHPKGVVAASDPYFATLANKIFRALLAEKLIKNDFDELFLRKIALKSASYLEDTVSKWGLFDGFRKLNTEICGKQLPFYTITEDYYTDEINIEDVQFLVWSTLQENVIINGENFVVNPDNPMIMFLSSLVYEMLDEEYETAPENDNIRLLLHEIDIEDFIAFRRLLEWLCYNSYLSTFRAIETIESLKVTIRKKFIRNINYVKHFNYLVESNGVLCYACTPLSVKALDWFRSITTNARMLERTKDLTFRAFQRYKIKGSDDSFIYLESFSEDKKEISLARKSIDKLNINHTREFSKGNDIVQTSLVFYDNIWQINGISVFGKMTEKIQAEEDQKVEEKKFYKETSFKNYQDILKHNRNKEIAFFKNSADLEKFWKKVFSDASNIDDFIKNHPYKNENNLVLFCHPKNDAVIMPDIAKCINYPGNELYQSHDSENEGLSLLTGGFSAPLEFLEFIIHNNYIPDAHINSLKSPERGKMIIQENKWFIVRFFQNELFDESIMEDNK